MSDFIDSDHDERVWQRGVDFLGRAGGFSATQLWVRLA
jgi:hypothetical protein